MSSTQHPASLQRWYVLLVFSLLGFLQALMWSTFSPIIFAVQFAYEWTEADLAVVLNWGSVASLAFLAPISGLMSRRGLRPTVLLVAFLVTVGCLLRLLGRSDVRLFFVLANASGILNGVAGVAVGLTPPVLAATWFPQSERTFATSVSMGAGLLGIGASFQLGTKMVPFDNTAIDKSTMDPEALSQKVLDVQETLHDYLLAQALAAVALLSVIFIHFPSKPQILPSEEKASKSDQNGGWSEVLSDPQMWLVCLSSSVPGAMFLTWQGLMSLNFGPLGVPDEEIGRIGFASIFSQVIVSTILAFVQDKLPREWMKLTLMSLLSGALLCYLWLTSLCLGFLPFSLNQLWAATILGGTLSYSALPVFYSYSLSLTKASEVMVGGLMSLIFTVTSILLMLALMLPDVGSGWMNYGLILTTAAAVPMVAATKRPEMSEKKSK